MPPSLLGQQEVMLNTTFRKIVEASDQYNTHHSNVLDANGQPAKVGALAVEGDRDMLKIFEEKLRSSDSDRFALIARTPL